MTARTWREEIPRLARRLAAAFDGIEERLAHRSQEKGGVGWSAAEVAEHVALANHFLLLLAEKAAEKGVARRAAGLLPPGEASRWEHLERIADREFAWESPSHMRPTGSVTERETIAMLRLQRRRALGILERTRDGSGALHTISMSVAGARLDLYQILAFVALHMERHARQMDRA